PEHERALREINEARAKKRAADELTARKEQAQVWKRVALAIPGVVAAVAIGWLIFSRRTHGLSVERALAGSTALFAPRGFVAQVTGEDHLDEALEPGCYVVVTGEKGRGILAVDHGGESLEGEGSIGWCSCTPERAEVRADGPVRILRVDGKTVGNLDGLGAV